LTDSERNILFTGDPEEEFDPYTYIWIYTYQEIAVQNPVTKKISTHPSI
jgi:hypothetical protein